VLGLVVAIIFVLAVFALWGLWLQDAKIYDLEQEIELMKMNQTLRLEELRQQIADNNTNKAPDNFDNKP
jgi:cell division protein FtsL